MLLRLTLLGAVLLLAACAAAVPGYSPPPFKEKKFGHAPESGAVASDGHYELSDNEKALDCKRLTGSMQITIARLRDGHGRVEPSAAATTMQSWTPSILGGSTAGADRQADYARERAKLDAFNRQLATKNCKTVDIDAELARPPEAQGKKY
jgi:hypothetical protein